MSVSFMQPRTCSHGLAPACCGWHPSEHRRHPEHGYKQVYIYGLVPYMYSTGEALAWDIASNVGITSPLPLLAMGAALQQWGTWGVNESRSHAVRIRTLLDIHVLHMARATRHQVSSTISIRCIYLYCIYYCTVFV